MLSFYYNFKEIKTTYKPLILLKNPKNISNTSLLLKIDNGYDMD